MRVDEEGRVGFDRDARVVGSRGRDVRRQGADSGGAVGDRQRRGLGAATPHVARFSEGGMRGAGHAEPRTPRDVGWFSGLNFISGGTFESRVCEMPLP